MNSSKKQDRGNPSSTETPPASIEFYSAQNYRPEDSIGYLMRLVLSTVRHEIERQLEPSDLTNAQWLPLFKLSIGKASTVAELARESQMDAGAMTRLLDRLEAKKLCRRVRSVEDRRVVHIELTDEGRVAAADIPVVLSRVQNALLSGFSVEEFEALKKSLRCILDNAQALSPNQNPTICGDSHEV